MHTKVDPTFDGVLGALQRAERRLEWLVVTEPEVEERSVEYLREATKLEGLGHRVFRVLSDVRTVLDNATDVVAELHMETEGPLAVLEELRAAGLADLVEWALEVQTQLEGVRSLDDRHALRIAEALRPLVRSL